MDFKKGYFWGILLEIKEGNCHISTEEPDLTLYISSNDRDIFSIRDCWNVYIEVTGF